SYYRGLRSLIISAATHECSMSLFCPYDPAPPEIYTLSLHDALPILPTGYNKDLQEDKEPVFDSEDTLRRSLEAARAVLAHVRLRSEEHTSELQSRENLVCRLLLEKNIIMRRVIRVGSGVPCYERLVV